MGRQIRQADDADRFCRTIQSHPGFDCLGASSIIVIFQDEDVAACERADAVPRPLAARDGGCAMVKRGDAVGILLALTDEYSCIWMRQHIWPSIEHPDFANARDPAASA